MNWTILYRWLLANFLGGVVGYLTGLLISTVIGGFSLLIGGVIGAVVGLAQWQVLHDYLPDLRAIQWVSFTALGYGLSLPLLSYLGAAMAAAASLQVQGDTIQGYIDLANKRNEVEALLAMAVSFWTSRLGAALVGALMGVVLGSAQWWVLRKHVRWAARWLAITAAGGIVGVSAALFASLYVYDRTANNVSLFILGLSLNPAGIFLVGSLITGLALVWLARKS
jgi:hypothetical protein